MKAKIFASLLLMTLLFILATTALALPEPCTAHYPRSGRLTLSPMKESNNTYAFRATARAHSRAHVQFIDAYAEQCGTTVSVQMFVVNKWGNWIAFGPPEIITLDCVPTTIDMYFSIRANREFCIVVTSYGVSGKCVMPYLIVTD